MDDTSFLDTLLSLGMIDQRVRGLALERLGEQGAEKPSFSNAGQMLHWLYQERILLESELTEERLEQQMDPAHAEELEQVLQDFARAGNIRAAEVEASAPGFGPFAFIGWGVALVAVGFGAWNLLGPTRTPQCGSQQVLSTVNAGARAVLRREQQQNPLMMLHDDEAAQEERRALMRARIQMPREIAYLKEEKMRVCDAVVVLDDEREEIAYTITLTGNGEFLVKGGHPEWLRAKYDPPEGAGEPLGAEAITGALRAATDRLEPPRAQRRVPGRFSREEPEVEREVLPLGPCVGDATDVVTCPVAFQRYDGLMRVFGAGMDVQLVKGDFGFVSTGSGWRVSDDFDEQYAHALVRGRMGELLGEEAAARYGRKDAGTDAQSDVESDTDIDTGAD